ncbi:MAG: RluA family pseudouridine synthase [Lentisphaerae bacterium]|nr:RluA family pseudouridine synthase [Lentisphaerota bacterium]
MGKIYLSSEPLPPILYEDELLIAFDKPSGLLTAPDRWDKTIVSLMGLIHEHLHSTIFNVHRLDRDTSGVVLCAKTKPALNAVCGQFQGHQTVKRYIAIVNNALSKKELTITAGIAEDPAQPGRMRIASDSAPGARVCETRIGVLERFRHYTFLEAFPVSGRTHQIRVHLRHVGHPIVADRFYGDGHGLMLSELKRDYKRTDKPERPLIGRLALHAESVTFRHPADGRTLTIQAPEPKDFSVALKYLRKFSAAQGGAEEN